MSQYQKTFFFYNFSFQWREHSQHFEFRRVSVVHLGECGRQERAGVEFRGRQGTEDLPHTGESEYLKQVSLYT